MELILVLLLGGGVYFLVRSRRERAVLADIGWVGADSVGPAPSRPTDAPLVVEPGSVDVAVTLGGIEGRRLFRSPLVWVGVALTLLYALALLDEQTPEEFEWLGSVVTHLPLTVYPFCGMVLLATNRAVLRERRDGTAELFATLPSSRSSRSTGHLLSLWAPLLVGAFLVGLALLVMVASSGKADDAGLFSFGPMEEALPSATGAYVLGSLVLVACAGLLGIGVARLVPYSIAGIVAIGVVGAVSIVGDADGTTAAVRSLSPYRGARSVPDIFALDDPWEHLVYLVGLGIIAVGAVRLLDGERRRGAAVLAGGLVVAFFAWAVPAMFVDEGRIDRVAAAVSDPRAHQSCIERDAITYCIYEPFERFVDDWVEAGAPVLAALPPSIDTRDLVVEQRPSPVDIANLDPRVRDRLEPAALGSRPYAWPADGDLHPELRWADSAGPIVYALTLGYWAVGLPASPSVDGPCYSGGQARAVVALWLAAQPFTVDDASRRYRDPDTGIGNTDYGDPRYADLLPPNWETNAGASVITDAGDRTVAADLLTRPADEVRSILHANWDDLTAPSAETPDLASLFGIDATDAGPLPEGVEGCA
jgi:hypothetical protein